jgi:hypothetical protein
VVIKPEGNQNEKERGSPSARTIQVLLVAIAIVAGFWGRHWATQLGW